MKRLLLATLTLTACTTGRPEPLPGPPQERCSTARLGGLVGRDATPMLVDRARRQARATSVRVLRPGQVVTMEYRYGRLNVHVDTAKRVQSFSCG